METEVSLNNLMEEYSIVLHHRKGRFFVQREVFRPKASLVLVESRML